MAKDSASVRLRFPSCHTQNRAVCCVECCWRTWHPCTQYLWQRIVRPRGRALCHTGPFGMMLEYVYVALMHTKICGKQTWCGCATPHYSVPELHRSVWNNVGGHIFCFDLHKKICGKEGWHVRADASLLIFATQVCMGDVYATLM